MNLIKEITLNGKNYVFNGKSLELFEKDDDEYFFEYLKEDSAIEAPYKNIKNTDCLFKLTLNVSNLCNLKCKYCYASHGNYGRPSSFMTKETVDFIIDDIKKRGFTSLYVVSLFGGEPTMNFDVVDYIIKKFELEFDKIFKFELTTNGTFLNKDRLTFLRDHNVKLVVSIDGPEDITDYLRGVGSHEIAYNIIKLAKEIKYKDIESSATFTKAHLEMGYNYNDIVEYFRSLEINSSISKVSINKESKLYIEDTINKEEFVNIVRNEIMMIYNGIPKILNPYLYAFLNSLIYGIKSFQFCDELQTNYSLAYDYDGALYNCFRLWGKKEFEIKNNELISFELSDINSKESFKKCKDCWARYLCKQCAAEIALGEVSLQIENDVCKDEIMFEICLVEFLSFIEKNDLDILVNNFEKYIRYQ